MKLLKRYLVVWSCLVHATLAVANPDAQRCQKTPPSRDNSTQGTLLWGARHGWDARQPASEQSSVLVSVDLAPVRHAGKGVKTLKWKEGRLGKVLAGTVLQGSASGGQPLEVAVCDTEPDSKDADVVWYRINAWNPVAQEWENPCVATANVPEPRALVVSGVWDATGAHHDAPGKVTFACENGAIAKCVRWGYKPWASRDGQSLADLHQACTRMARADYCGDGHSHTQEGTMIDMYDSLGLLTRTESSAASGSPAKASFEAAWAPDGAACMAQSRDGRSLEKILAECPGRFVAGAAVELGGGDRCTVQRTGMSPGAAHLRNAVVRN